jgi:hypothetical protein
VEAVIAAAGSVFSANRWCLNEVQHGREAIDGDDVSEPFDCVLMRTADRVMSSNEYWHIESSPLNWW